MVELDVKIGPGELYDYLLMHAYSGLSGLLGSGIGALMVVFALSAGQWLYLICGAILLLYTPWTLFVKSRQQALNNPAFKKPLHYLLDEQGLTVSQGDASETIGWDNMVKAVSTGRSIILYTSRVNATIFPKRQMGEQKDAVIEIISTHMPPSKVKIRTN